MKRHIGKLKNSGNNVVVVFMHLPDDPSNCLIVDVDSVPDIVRDDVHEIVHSSEAQNSRSIHDLLNRRMHRNGGSILEYLHMNRHLMKVATEDVMMTPRNDVSIPLSEVNNSIRKMEEGTQDKSDADIEVDRNVKKQQVERMQEKEKESIGNNLLYEAEELELQSQMLLSEAKRKREQAKAYMPQSKPVQKQTPKSVPESKPVENTVQKKRGRPKKNEV
jgi:hypothetical protein